MRRRVPAGAAVALIAGGLAGGLAAQERVAVWSAWADGGYAGALDCTDCYEDEYVALSCERESDDVAVALIGLVPGEDATGARMDVTLDVDGRSERRLAEIEDSEMFGPVPVLTLAGDDPLFTLLRTGTTLTLSGAGDSLAVPLTGAAEALDAMFDTCR